MNNSNIDLEEIISHYNDTIDSLEILVEHTEKEPYTSHILLYMFSYLLFTLVGFNIFNDLFYLSL